jgi:hypothetical protein
MLRKSYVEEFDDGPGGWLRMVDNYQPPAALPVQQGAIWSYGPWWLDYNHAPPGAGYLQLLMCLYTRGPLRESVKEAGGLNRFVADRYPTDLTGAAVTVRARGELEAAGGNVCLLIQSIRGGICSGWVLSGQPVQVGSKFTDTRLRLVPDERQWTCLGSRHDRQDNYGCLPLNETLGDVNMNVYLVIFPVNPRPVGPIAGDPHLLRAGRDYPVWPSSVAQGYVAVDRIEIAYAREGESR